MTLTEARKILGLGPDEDPRPHLEEFRAVREKIADMVRMAPNEMLAERYQEGLVEFDKALAAVREYLEALGLIPREMDVEVKEAGFAGRGNPVFVDGNIVREPVGPPLLSTPLPTRAPEISEISDREPWAGKLFRLVCCLLLFMTLVGLGGWLYFKVQEDKELAMRQRVVFLESQGASFIENRRWPEAKGAFDEIEELDPDSDLADKGRRGIEAGMAEEQSQFIGYWKGEAIASFETGRWADAEIAARQVLDKYPAEEELLELVAKIAVAKKEEEWQSALEGVRKQIGERKFDGAISSAKELSEGNGENEGARALLKEAEDAKSKAEADLVIAKGLLAKAVEKDKGEFDEEAINWLREAVSLAPDDKEVLASYEKMAAYSRTIRVPEDVKTLEEALASARDRDRIVLGEGTWQGPFVIVAAVELEGVSGKTVVECAANAGSVISFSPGVDGARLSGLTLRHLSFDNSEERFSLTLVRGGKVDFSDCRFEQGSGHGIAVTEGGSAKVLRCRFTENGWNGIAAMGVGSLLEAEENTLKDNFQNGIESWDGAAVILRKNICTGNSRNGINVDNGAASATIRDNELKGNREFGLVLGSAGSGQVGGNSIEKNFLGGMVVKAGASEVIAKGNTIRGNAGPGLVLEKGVPEENFVGNAISGNKGDELVTGVDLSK